MEGQLWSVLYETVAALGKAHSSKGQRFSDS